MNFVIIVQGIKLTQTQSTIDEDKYYKRFVIPISLHAGSPDKYKELFLAAANTCNIKKLIQAMPESNVQIVE